MSTVIAPTDSAEKALDTARGCGDWELAWMLAGCRMQLWARHRILGFWWWLLEPLAMTATYMVLVGGAFRAGSSHFALFLICAVLPWSWFLAATGTAMVSLTQHAALIRASRLNYGVLPTSEVLACTVRYLASLLIPMALMVYYHISPTLSIAYMPLLIAAQFTFTLGVGMWLSLAHVFAEDVANAWRVLTRIWFFLSPALYSLEQAPALLRPWARWNPFAPIFAGYRDILIHGRAPLVSGLLLVFMVGILLCLTARMALARSQGVLSRVL